MELEYTAQSIFKYASKPTDLPLFIIPRFLSPSLLNAINTNWPNKDWRGNGQLNSNRKQFRINEKTGFWNNIQSYFIESKTISYMIYNLFKQVPSYTKILTDLWEDHEGYAVGQHLDNPRIQITCQVYLSDNNDQLEHGAKICSEQGEVIYNVPMQNNLCWVALNTEDMYHKVNPYPLKIPRRSLVFRYMR